MLPTLKSRSASRRRFRCRLVAASRCVAVALASASITGLAAPAAWAGEGTDYSSEKVVVGVDPAGSVHARAAAASSSSDAEAAAQARVVRLRAGETVPIALHRLRREHGIAWAVPDYRAHIDGTFIPDDRGIGPAEDDWEQLQWNFFGPNSINAPEAW